MSGQGTPLGLLLRPERTPTERQHHGGRGRVVEDEVWPCPTAGGPRRRRRRSWAILKLVALAGSLAAALVVSVLIGAVSLWWWVQHLASASPRR